MRVLLAAHLIVGVAPAAMYVVLLDTRYLPLMWALASVGLGQLMLLMLWVGMGTAGPVSRIVGSLFGSAYLAVWPIVWQMLVGWSDRIFSPLDTFVVFALAYWAAVLVLGGAFLLVCRLSDMRLIGSAEARASDSSSQYTVRQLLVLVTLAAVVLAASRLATSATQDPSEVSRQLTTVVNLFVLAAGAAWAALSPGRIGWRIIVVMLTAIGLVFVQARGAPAREWPDWLWQVFGFRLMILILPTLIVIGTLLVVRSCGYRLLRKTVQRSAATRLAT